jgi:hypothetical protein
VYSSDDFAARCPRVVRGRLRRRVCPDAPRSLNR